MKQKIMGVIISLLVVFAAMGGFSLTDDATDINEASADAVYEESSEDAETDFDEADINSLSEDVTDLGEPYFTEDEIEKAKQGSFTDYEGLDGLGRVIGVCASINASDLPTGERDDGDELRNIYPAGWDQEYYGEDYIEGEYLYNRSHALMYALGGETSERNIFTGTRYLNATLMLDYEEEALSYVRSYEKCRLLYRVTPIYEGDNLVPSGVLMEALSLDSVGLGKEDGTNLKFCVYLKNVQPGIEIDYSDGSSSLAE
ncbi:MAG: DNA/RNA non-specific endonuclease [Eubacterium sp.]|nr:DNA/RNA non-specific endonuclease [Eubacterium sp.]